jgi:hypothetical protein
MARHRTVIAGVAQSDEPHMLVIFRFTVHLLENGYPVSFGALNLPAAGSEAPR